MRIKSIEQMRRERKATLLSYYGDSEHYWFAWRPVKTEEGYWVWLEYVIRRKIRGKNPVADVGIWNYYLPAEE